MLDSPFSSSPFIETDGREGGAFPRDIYKVQLCHARQDPTNHSPRTALSFPITMHSSYSTPSSSVSAPPNFLLDTLIC